MLVVEAYEWIPTPPHVKVSQDHFACKVVGESMNKVIPNGSVCLFRKYSGGSRNGKIVLVELSHLQDPDSGSHYTVKEYESVKLFEQTGEWAHDLISSSRCLLTRGMRRLSCGRMR